MVTEACLRRCCTSFGLDVASRQEESAGVPEIVPDVRGEAYVLKEQLGVAVDYVLGARRVD